MITITNNSIIIPQGETATISFGFKDQKTNDPLILLHPEYDHYIHVVIKDKLTNKGEAVLAKAFKLENNVEDPEAGWRIFDDYIVGEQFNTSSEFIDYLETSEELSDNVLVKANIGVSVAYGYRLNGVAYDNYDYKNSSITIQFERSDTKDLMPKTYYLEIYHEMIKDGQEPIKHTLLSPTDFIVKGALA